MINGRTRTTEKVHSRNALNNEHRTFGQRTHCQGSSTETGLAYLHLDQWVGGVPEEHCGWCIDRIFTYPKQRTVNTQPLVLIHSRAIEIIRVLTAKTLREHFASH